MAFHRSSSHRPWCEGGGDRCLAEVARPRPFQEVACRLKSSMVWAVFAVSVAKKL